MWHSLRWYLLPWSHQQILLLWGREELNHVRIRFWEYKIQRCRVKGCLSVVAIFLYSPSPVWTLCTGPTRAKHLGKLRLHVLCWEYILVQLWWKLFVVTGHFRDVECFLALGFILHHKPPFIPCSYLSIYTSGYDWCNINWEISSMKEIFQLILLLSNSHCSLA